METPSRVRSASPLWATLVAFGLAVFGIVATQFTTLPAIFLEPALIESPGDTSIGARALLMTLNFLGFALAGAIYLAATDRGWSYVDLRMPTKRGWLYVLAGIVGSLVFYFLVSILIQLLSLPATDNQVMQYIAGDQTMILVMILIVFFFNAPAEEFLFRNVIQKRLYEAFSRFQAVLVASAIFALIHFPVYLAASGDPLAIGPSDLLATTVPLVVVFGGSVIFGYVYAKTDNLVVPTAAHAAFNAFQFGLVYLALEFDLETGEPVQSLLVDLLAVVPV
ncbi:CPBP family intramembrane glutamic endopeptidase [Natrarchaeobius chitinivorans]|uniref:CPBP family intramembrane metalloprotease n=1 Tax=Natrarchaeobius chitinivorans TaxID=1679083 RepID=A0A3N6ML88_NATCH|nr:CPBP family intramembrane glutamic endopeptidase [Natrarchaeobius chitinivorans]RQG95096.1 CPBP family intramembrane metalloprotease [Natrarchaeobius chitinivorans]